MAYAMQIHVEIDKGSNIMRACREAKALSEFTGLTITFMFNDTEISTKDKSAQEMIDAYARCRG